MAMASKEVIALRRCIKALEGALPDLEETNHELVMSMLAELQAVNHQVVDGQIVDWVDVGHQMLQVAEVLHVLHVAAEVVSKVLG